MSISNNCVYMISVAWLSLNL